VECVLGSWKHGSLGQANEFSQKNCGDPTNEYINGLKKISKTRWTQVLSGAQQFTPYKPREVTADLEENYRTKAPESGELKNRIIHIPSDLPTDIEA